MVRSGKPKVNIEAIMQKKDEFQLKLLNRFEKLSGKEDTEEMAEIITKAIQECALETTGKDARSRKEKLKPKAKELLKQRREMADKDQTAKRQRLSTVNCARPSERR